MLSREHSLGAAPRVETPAPASSSPDDVRDDPRVPFLGYPFELRAGRTTSSIRLRDLSCGGTSGLCDEPLDVGALVTVHFSKEQAVEAEVRWIRLMYVGLKFKQPIAPGFVRRLHQAHGTFVTTRSKK
jgi:hypothetical protein